MRPILPWSVPMRGDCAHTLSHGPTGAKHLPTSVCPTSLAPCLSSLGRPLTASDASTGSLRSLHSSCRVRFLPKMLSFRAGSWKSSLSLAASSNGLLLFDSCVFFAPCLTHISVIIQLFPLTSFNSFISCLANRCASLRPPMAVPKFSPM